MLLILLVNNTVDNVTLLNEYINPVDILPKQVCLESGKCMIGLRSLPNFLAINEQFNLVRKEK